MMFNKTESAEHIRPAQNSFIQEIHDIKLCSSKPTFGLLADVKKGFVSKPTSE